MILTKVKNEVGATAIEYGLIASLVAVVAVSGMSAVGMNLKNTYCTISTHLGGSGTCSGATSSGPSGTGGNGSSAVSGSGSSVNNSEAGGTTGSPDLDSLTGSAYLNTLQGFMVDDVDPTYLDKSLGGSNTKDGLGPIDNPQEALTLMNNYNNDPKNSNDQITHVYGLYDTTTGNAKPITSWQTASESLENQINGNNNVVAGSKHYASLEVTTQSGRVYIVDSYDKTMTPQNPIKP